MKKYLPGLLVVVCIAAIYFPARNLSLMGDDFEWLETSYSGWKHPLSLAALIVNFFRPLVKFSYLVDYTLFGTHAAFYNATTLGIHLVNVFLLYLCLLRVTNRRNFAAIIALLFGTSSLYSEVTLWAAGRPDSLLLLFMLGVFLIVSCAELPLNLKQHAAIIALAIGAAGSKETWVLLPLLVGSFWLIVTQYPLKPAIHGTLSLGVILAIYLAGTFGLPLLFNTASPVGYADATIRTSLVKIGYVIARYAGFSDLYSGAIWEAMLIILAVAVFGYRLLRTKNRLAIWGMVWMLLTIGITLIVALAPSRYNYLPLIGFWIMIVAWVDYEAQRIPCWFRLEKFGKILVIGIALTGYVTYHAIMLHWEIRDYARHAKSHAAIVEMYRKIQAQIPDNQPICFVNNGKRQPIREVMNALQGYPKLMFVRPTAIWELVHFAPLVDFLGEPFKRRLIPMQPAEIATLFEHDFTVVVFTDAGFVVTSEFHEELYDVYLQHARQLPTNVTAYKFVSN